MKLKELPVSIGSKLVGSHVRDWGRTVHSSSHVNLARKFKVYDKWKLINKYNLYLRSIIYVNNNLAKGAFSFWSSQQSDKEHNLDYYSVFHSFFEGIDLLHIGEYNEAQISLDYRIELKIDIYVIITLLFEFLKSNFWNNLYFLLFSSELIWMIYDFSPESFSFICQILIFLLFRF